MRSVYNEMLFSVSNGESGFHYAAGATSHTWLCPRYDKRTCDIEWNVTKWIKLII